MCVWRVPAASAGGRRREQRRRPAWCGGQLSRVGSSVLGSPREALSEMPLGPIVRLE